MARPRVALWGGLLALAACAGLRHEGSGDGSARARAGDAVAVEPRSTAEPFVLVLGIAQDAGYPQTACRRGCCSAAWRDSGLRRLVSCVAVVDPVSRERWVIDATPDFREQVHRLDAAAPFAESVGRAELSGVLVTHAHVGHYTGLQNLGREATGEAGVPVYVMPRMKRFLEDNGPWGLLVGAGHVSLREMAADVPVRLNDRITVTPIVVPHRDEYSETVGFRIEGPGRSVLFLPDIDKWEKWERRIEEEIARVHVAYLDGTFFSAGEVPGRNMAEIPHPFMEESMARLGGLAADVRLRVRFIHLNHTNPAIREGSEAAREVERRGFGVASEGERVGLGG